MSLLLLLVVILQTTLLLLLIIVWFNSNEQLIHIKIQLLTNYYWIKTDTICNNSLLYNNVLISSLTKNL